MDEDLLGDKPAAAAAGAAADDAAAAGPDRLELERLERRVVPYWVLANVVSSAVLGGLLTGGVLYLRTADAVRALTYTTVGIVLVSLLVLLAFLQPPLAYMTWRYAMDDELLVMRYGILFREEKTIPISRLQHVDLRRGPIERVFQLATLVVFTAGSEGATFRVPGLTVERARSMRDRILARRGDDVV